MWRRRIHSSFSPSSIIADSAKSAVLARELGDALAVS